MIRILKTAFLTIAVCSVVLTQENKGKIIILDFEVSDMEESENNQSPIFVSYIFYGSGNEIISEGEQEITLVQIPESFALN